jgi:1-acyl-sn-glycerol-3-phosphate acyltransferase
VKVLPSPFRELPTARFVVAAGLVGLCAAGITAKSYPQFDPLHKLTSHDRGPEFVAGLLLGGLIAGLRWHPYRATALIPVAAAGWFVATVVSIASGVWAGWPHGLACGIVLVTAARFVERFSPRGIGGAELVGTAVGLGGLWAATGGGGAGPETVVAACGWYLLGLTAIVTVVSLVAFARPLVEIAIRFTLLRGYRTRGAGPGLDAFPMGGPVLVIANHASYLDPGFLGQVLPRPVTAMMTATFFDKPIVRPLMVHVFGTIRVSEDPIKRDASELREAIAALGDGKCLLVFPEGYLRRKDDVPLKRFGRGVWEILKAHPETPVVACWIEGAWGSYYSFWNGPPTENKPAERGRPIGVGVSAAVTIPPDVLADHLTTRLYLMNLVLGARAHLGLPELPPVELPKRGEAQPAAVS